MLKSDPECDENLIDSDEGISVKVKEFRIENSGKKIIELDEIDLE